MKPVHSEYTGPQDTNACISAPWSLSAGSSRRRTSSERVYPMRWSPETANAVRNAGFTAPLLRRQRSQRASNSSTYQSITMGHPRPSTTAKLGGTSIVSRQLRFQSGQICKQSLSCSRTRSTNAHGPARGARRLTCSCLQQPPEQVSGPSGRPTGVTMWSPTSNRVGLVLGPVPRDGLQTKTPTYHQR